MNIYVEDQDTVFNENGMGSVTVVSNSLTEVDRKMKTGGVNRGTLLCDREKVITTVDTLYKKSSSVDIQDRNALQ